MTETLTVDRLSQARGQPAYSSDGEKIGTVEEIFVDEETGQPEWVTTGTGLLGTKKAVVPVQAADLREDGLYVPYSKDQVQGAPDVDLGGEEIAQADEQALYSHYGLGYSERRSDTGLPEGTAGTARGGAGAAAGTAGGTEGTTATREREGEVTRTEEELQVGKRETEAGRARLRKWVETEPAEVDVELRREAARVTREPIEQPVSGAELGEQEVEVPLRAEEPVVEKETVAKERIGVEKDVATERETVGDELRKERVEVEGDVEGR